MRPFCPELDSSVHLITLKIGSLLHSVLLGWQQRNLNADIHSVHTFKFSRTVSQTTGNSEVCPSLLAIGSERRDQLMLEQATRYFSDGGQALSSSAR